MVAALLVSFPDTALKYSLVFNKLSQTYRGFSQAGVTHPRRGGGGGRGKLLASSTTLRCVFGLRQRTSIYTHAVRTLTSAASIRATAVTRDDGIFGGILKVPIDYVATFTVLG